jgi:laminin alpha 3/5
VSPDIGSIANMDVPVSKYSFIVNTIHIDINEFHQNSMPTNFNTFSACNCAEKYSYGAVCDQKSGQCQCLPGVVGEKCDSCPHRWVFIPKTGCRECGPCVHVLLDDTDQLALLIDPLRDEMQDTSSSVFAYRRLTHVNKTLEMNEKSVVEMQDSPNKIDLGSVSLSAQNLEQESNSLHSKVCRLKSYALF